jgi:hypothetical protein
VFDDASEGLGDDDTPSGDSAAVENVLFSGFFI